MMTARVSALTLALGCVALPRLVAAQGTPSPLADAFRADAQTMTKNIVAAFEGMPAEKYGFKPTPAQMSVADVAVHIAGDNDFLCSAIGGMPAPERAKVAATDPKDKLVARVRESFQFCEAALAKIDDSKLGEQVPWEKNHTVSRARAIVETVDDWSDHYSQLAIYLRLNGLLPPTARPKSS